jgi:hypothetical protein
LLVTVTVFGFTPSKLNEPAWSPPPVGDDLGGRIGQVAHHLPADRGVGVE